MAISYKKEKSIKLDKIKKYNTMVQFIYVLFYGNGYLFYFVIINNFLSQFEKSIPVIFSLSIGMMFFSLKIVPSSYLNVKGYLKTLNKLQALLTLVNLLAFFIIITKEDIFYTAISKSFCFILFSFIYYYLMCKDLLRDKFSVIKNITFNLLVILSSIFGLLIAETIFDLSFVIDLNFYIVELIKMLLSMVIFTLFIILNFSIFYKKDKFFFEIISLFILIKNKLRFSNNNL